MNTIKINQVKTLVSWIDMKTCERISQLLIQQAKSYVPPIISDFPSFAELSNSSI